LSETCDTISALVISKSLKITYLSFLRAAKILVYFNYKYDFKVILAFMNFSDELLGWYDQNKRDLPWRNIDNPYVIWIAEVVFQQTRIEQGLPYFLKFMEKFPSLYDLADASEEDVLKKWQGLGYYSRARNLRFSAKYIVNELNGKFPDNYETLLKLKGVGPYIAAEVASVCFDEVVAAIDGNVQRVISRYFGVEEAINSPEGAKQIKEFATAHISKNRPGDFNQALMDLGSFVCSPQKPKCESCFLVTTCWAVSNKKLDQIPYKLKKVKVRSRYFNFLLIFKDGKLAVNKRSAGDVWQGLYQMPLIEMNENIASFSDLKVGGKGYLLRSGKRILSHQRLHLNFWVTDLDKSTDRILIEKWCGLDELLELPVPKSIEQLFLSKEFKSLFDGI
jgi:A/G-specific adenine glycosylase